jgi:hypothetical protein
MIKSIFANLGRVGNVLKEFIGRVGVIYILRYVGSCGKVVHSISDRIEGKKRRKKGR